MNFKKNKLYKKINPVLFSSILAIAFIMLLGKIIFFSINKYYDWKEKNIMNVGKYTTATIIKRDFSKSSHCIYEFSINRIKYKGDTNCNKDIQLGENYLLLYDTINPKNNKLLFEYPSFLKNQVVDSLCCEVISIDDYDVKVRYFINEKEYTRFQRIKSIGKIYQLGNEYKFKFLVENPNIGFIENFNCNSSLKVK